MVHDLVHVTGKGLLGARTVDTVVLFEQPLQRLVGIEVVLLQAKNLEGLTLSHEPTLDPQSLFGNALSALVSELFGTISEPLFLYKPKDSVLALLPRERAESLFFNMLLLILFHGLFLNYFLYGFLVQEFGLVDDDLLDSARVSFLLQ